MPLRANPIPPLLVYLGSIVTLTGVVAVIWPIRVIGLDSPSRAALALIGGLALVAIGMVLPAEEIRVGARRTRLDEFAPAYHFNEVHTVRIAAPPAAVYRAILQVTPGEILFFRAMTWIRRGGRNGPESILNAPADRPILDVATKTGFLALANDPDQEIVVGMVVLAPSGAARGRVRTPEDFKAIDAPGFAKAVMNFRLAPDGNEGTMLSTETRVFATSAEPRRRFAKYWRVIYPGSAILRRSWLRAIRRRAEGRE
jgi:hypothetical protein